jgi:pimeloyl-ACP methyl ester carboxylesterase
MPDLARVRRYWQPLGVMLIVLMASVFAGRAEGASIVDVGTDARFEPAVAYAGMKHPRDFRYAGLYVSTPIDSSRQPVLFVHGADGTPRDLEALAADLDPTRQQAWFAYYATGNSIDESGHALAEEIVATMRRHGLTSITVVAHSMGGLVAWRAITELEEQVTVTRFVSINTPWGGITAARFGAWLSPSPLPIWRDLAPGSKALNAIHGERVRAPWTLVYTVQEDSTRSSGDGTVSRWSQVLPSAQTQATTVVREIGTHMTALQEPQARRISALLAL